MEIWGKDYSKFTPPQFCPFQKLIQNQKLPIDQFHYWFTYVDCHLKDIQTSILFNLLINNTLFIFNQWMQMINK